MSNEIESQYPLLKGMTQEEILVAAERWQAITTGPRYAFQAAHIDIERVSKEKRHVVTTTMELDEHEVGEHPGSKAAREDGVLKLTELADLVRARALK